MGRGENITLTGGRRWVSAPMQDPEGFKTSVQEVAADVEETAREPELEVEPEDVAESLKSQISLKRMRGCANA